MTQNLNLLAVSLRLPVAGSLALATVLALPAHAQEWQGGADVSLGVEATSNPYLDQNGSDLTLAGSGRVASWLTYTGERTTYSLNAAFDGRAFASDGYDFEDNYSISTGLVHRASERLTLRANGGLFSTATSFGSLLSGAVGAVDSPPLPDLPNVIDPGEDVTLLGRRGRNSALILGAGADIVLDPRNRLSLSGNFRDSWSNRLGSQDYRTYDTQARFMHVIDQSTSVGASVSYQQTDYKQALSGNARTISTMGSLTQRLGQYWTLDASVGAAFSRIDASLVAPEDEYTSLSAEASLCNRTERRGLCFSYSRAPQPSAFGGLRNSDRFGLSLDARVSERDRLSVGASYDRNGEAEIDPVAYPQIDYLSLRTQLRRQFSRRVSGFVSGAVSHVDQPAVDVDPNVTIGAGVTVSLGRLR